MAGIHVQLFGRVGLRVGAVEVDVPAGLPQRVLGALVAASGRRLSGDTLLDRLWQQAPRSGRNALQRHVSALRSSVRDVLTDDEQADWLRWEHGHYVLDQAVTDDLRELVSAVERRDHIDPVALYDSEAVRWWEEPLPGLTGPELGPLAVRLESLARARMSQLRVHGLDAAGVDAAAGLLDDLLERRPTDDRLWRLRLALHDDADAPARREVHARMATAYAAASLSTPVGLRADPSGRGVRAVEAEAMGVLVRAWLGGRDAVARRQASSTPALQADTRHRLRRSLALLNPSDGLVRLMASESARFWSTSPDRGRRCLVSLDAYALAHHPDGLRTAVRELDDARLDPVMTRRVLAFVTMHRPLGDGFPAACATLDACDDPVAQVEAVRMRAVLLARQGDLVGVRAALERYEAAARMQGIDAASEFVTTSQAVLHLAAREPRGAGTRPAGVAPSLMKDAVLDLATVWEDLRRGATDAATRGRVASLGHMGLTPSALSSLFVLERANSGDVAGAGRELESLVGRLAGLPLGPFNVLTLVTCLLAARVLGHDDQVSAVRHRLAEERPGEMLGVWPLDLLLGPVDDVIEDRIGTGRATVGANRV